MFSIPELFEVPFLVIIGNCLQSKSGDSRHFSSSLSLAEVIVSKTFWNQIKTETFMMKQGKSYFFYF
jgi:hypothetical protein